MKIGVFMANFQPLHKSHEFIIQKALRENDVVYIFVKDTDGLRNANTPFTVKERQEMINRVFPPVIFKNRLFVVPLTSTFNQKDSGLYEKVVNIIKEPSFSLYYSNTSKNITNCFTKKQKDLINFCFVDREQYFAGLTTREIRKALLENNNHYLTQTLPCEIYRRTWELKRIISTI